MCHWFNVYKNNNYHHHHYHHHHHHHHHGFSSHLKLNLYNVVMVLIWIHLRLLNFSIKWNSMKLTTESMFKMNLLLNWPLGYSISSQCHSQENSFIKLKTNKLEHKIDMKMYWKALKCCFKVILFKELNLKCN